MNNPQSPRSVPDLIALVNAMIDYWRAIAMRNFERAHPLSNPSEFDQLWPKILANFFLAETVRTANALRLLADGRLN